MRPGSLTVPTGRGLALLILAVAILALMALAISSGQFGDHGTVTPHAASAVEYGL
jgi:hypothetical protein